MLRLFLCLQQNDPFNVAAAVAKCYELGDSPTDTTTYYTVGYVTEIREISTTYGNATFTISDTKKGSVNNLTIYRARGFNGESITDEKLFQIGDSVVVCGKLINYKGTTPELNQGYIVSINGKGDNKPDTTEIGTLSNPMTVANALSMIEKLEDNTATASAYYIKGKIFTLNDQQKAPAISIRELQGLLSFLEDSALLDTLHDEIHGSVHTKLLHVQ